jgi:hypothetical protein
MGIRALIRMLQRPAVAKRSSITPSMYEGVASGVKSEPAACFLHSVHAVALNFRSPQGLENTFLSYTSSGAVRIVQTGRSFAQAGSV